MINAVSCIKLNKTWTTVVAGFKISGSPVGGRLRKYSYVSFILNEG